MVMIIMWLSLLISSIFTWLLLASMGPLDGWAFSIWLAVDIKVLIIDAFMSFFYILLHIYWYWIEARTLCILPEYTVLHEGVPVETFVFVFSVAVGVYMVHHLVQLFPSASLLGLLLVGGSKWFQRVQLVSHLSYYATAIHCGRGLCRVLLVVLGCIAEAFFWQEWTCFGISGGSVKL